MAHKHKQRHLQKHTYTMAYTMTHIMTNKKQITYHLIIHTLPYTHLHGMTHKHNNSHKMRKELLTNITIIKQSFTHNNTFNNDTNIHEQKSTKWDTKKIHAHYDRIREKQNKIDKVKSNLFFLLFKC